MSGADTGKESLFDDVPDLGGGEAEPEIDELPSSSDQHASLLGSTESASEKKDKNDDHHKEIGFVRGYLVGMFFAGLMEVVIYILSLVINLTRVIWILLFVALVVGGIVAGVIFKTKRKKRWVIVGFCGAMAGLLGGYMGSRSMLEYAFYKSGSALTAVDAETMPPALSEYHDAGVVEFLNITTVHFEIAGADPAADAMSNTYCAAPLQTLTDFPAEKVSFWAVDQDCCAGTSAQTVVSSCSSWARNEHGSAVFLEGQVVPCAEYESAISNGESWFGYESYNEKMCVIMAESGDQVNQQSHRLLFGLLWMTLCPLGWPVFFVPFYLMCFLLCSCAEFNGKQEAEIDVDDYDPITAEDV